jgi:hypothetical protein
MMEMRGEALESVRMIKEETVIIFTYFCPFQRSLPLLELSLRAPLCLSISVAFSVAVSYWPSNLAVHLVSKKSKNTNC